MDIAILHLEMLGLSALAVALFHARSRFGLAPLYVFVGMLLVFQAVASRLHVMVPVAGSDPARYAGLVHLPLVLTAVVLVYVLEGTRAARHLIGALFLSALLLLGMRALLTVRLGEIAAMDVDGHTWSQYGEHRWTNPGVVAHLVSGLAWLVDGVVIIVVYQALVNLSDKVPVVIAFSLALLAGTVTDALVYGGLSGSLDIGTFGGEVIGKLTAGIAAAIPAALYMNFAFRKYSDDVRGGVLHRGALEILSLKRELQTARVELTQSRAETQHVQSIFRRYVAPDVVDEILSEPDQLQLGGQEREVTIVFSDIRGYSTVTENMGPVATIGLLNRYFAAMSEVINEYRGTIIEFEGDAILTVFNAPLDQEDHAERAVRSSIAMLERLLELEQEWEADGTAAYWKDVGIPTFRIRIGIHTGPVVVGNVGSESRAKYAVIGDTVNTAARVETLNKDVMTSLLISGTTEAQLDAPDLDLIDMGKHRVKGRREPVHVFTVEGLPSALAYERSEDG